MAPGERLSHAYIIASLSERARNDGALALAAATLCAGGEETPKPCRACRHCRKVYAGVHPDLTLIERQVDDKSGRRRDILVDQIRFLVRDAVVVPNEAEKKVYIIRDADTMNAPAQNALLKLLEEPPRHAAFILCAENDLALLDTVRSRCEALHVNAGEETPGEAGRVLAERYLKLAAAGDRAGLLRLCAENGTMEKEAALDFTAAARALLGDMLCLRRGDMGLARERLMALMALMDRAERYLTMNVGVRHVFGMLSVPDIFEMRK